MNLDRRALRQQVLPAMKGPEMAQCCAVSGFLRSGKLHRHCIKELNLLDPAVGSGAFPLGMLNEIVRARHNISAYLAITMNAYDTRMMYSLERSPHNLKYETIKTLKPQNLR